MHQSMTHQSMRLETLQHKLQHTLQHTLQHSVLQCDASKYGKSKNKTRDTLKSSCSMLQYVLHAHACCNMCCITMQHGTTRYDTLRTATHCNVLQHVATHRNTLQHAATRCTRSNTNCISTATRCSTVQHTATTCHIQQHNAPKHFHEPLGH